MRPYAITAVLLLWATTAHASDWEGTWNVDGGGQRTLARERGLLALDASFEAGAGKCSFHLVGAPSGHALHLQGSSDGSTGFVGALGGKKGGGGRHQATVDATLDDGVVTARCAVDGADRGTETWRRGGIEVVALLEGEKPASGAVDLKRSRTGLVIRYKVSGAAMNVTARIVVAPGHPYASFYASPTIATIDAGHVEPGEHEITWDGRDDTGAKRIALAGSYDAVVSSNGISAQKGFSVTPPWFEAIASNWPAVDQGPGKLPLPAWKPAAELELLSLFQGGLLMPGLGGGYVSPGPSIVTAPEEALARARDAATLVLATHGSRGSLTVHGRVASISYEPARLFGRELKDCHVAIASACFSGNDENGPSVVQELVGAGCDVAIGFKQIVGSAEAADFEGWTLVLVSLGAPVAKAASDAARFAGRIHAADGVPAGGARIRDCLAVARAAGIPEDESSWPPRYGSSTN
jgi:hypothetical protein